MSKIAFTPNASGTGTFSIASPGTNTDRTLTLPDATGTVVLTDATQTLTNKSIDAAQLTGALASALVGTATAGLAYGAVGTYVFAGTSGTVAASTTLANPGDTVAGSSYNAVGLFNFAGTGAQSDAGTLSGTWRVMGFLRNGSASTAQRVATLLMRIS
jgi:hypothetical protein